MLLTVRKNEHLKYISKDQLDSFLARGYSIVEPEVDKTDVVQTNIRGTFKSVLVELEKDGRVKAVLPTQVKDFLEKGFKPLNGDENERIESGISAEGFGVQPEQQGRGEASGSEGQGSGPSSEAEPLDQKDDSLWTAQGFPRAAAVSKIAGTQVTADEIKEAIPDFKRG